MIDLDPPYRTVPRFLFADHTEERENPESPMRLFVIHTQKPRFLMEVFIKDSTVDFNLAEAIDPIPPEQASKLAQEAGKFAIAEIENRTE